MSYPAQCILYYHRLFGASLSEPHIDELNVRNLYIIIIIYYYHYYGTYVTRAPL